MLTHYLTTSSLPREVTYGQKRHLGVVVEMVVTSKYGGLA